MKLTPETVSSVIKGWNIMFSGNRQDEELAFISAKFFKALKDSYNNDTFKIAAELVESTEKFFPTIAHMKEVREQTYQKKQSIIASDCLMLTEETELTEEERQINLQKIEIIKKQLSGQLSAEEAIAMQDKISKYAK